MKTLLNFILSLLFLACFSLADENKATDDNDILSAVYALQKLNSQLQILSNDANSTNVQTLKNRKYRLLSQIPSLITKIEISNNDKSKFYAKKSTLEKTLNRYSKNKESENYVKTAIKLDELSINEMFFKSVLELRELFKNGSKTATIKDVLESSIIELRTNQYQNISSVSQSVLQEYQKELGLLDTTKKTSEEILEYLKDNADLISSSFVLNELNLKTAIEYINQKFPLKINGINFGKIFIISLVFVFFVSFTRVIARLTYWLIVSLRKNLKSNTDDLKDQILKIVKKPISYFLIAYALKVCVEVGYYPLPMPLSIANIFAIIYIVLASWWVISMLDGYGLLIISEITKKSGRKEVINLVLKLVYFIVIVITLLFILSRLGFNISAIIASLGIGGLAVAFAAKDIIANFFSSVMILVDNSFSQGDIITCGSIEGTIVEIGLRHTTIRSADNALIFVPNSTLASNAIINWSRRKVGRIINLSIGLTYDSKPEALRQCIKDIKDMLLAHDGISKQDKDDNIGANLHLKFRRNIVSIDDLAGYKNAIYVSLDALNDSSIDIAITCFTKTTLKSEYVEVKEDVIFKIMQIVAKNGLEFAFPSQSLYVQTQNQQFLS